MRLHSFKLSRASLHISKETRNKLFNIAAFIPAVLGLISAVFMIYIFWWPVDGAYQIDKPEQHAVVYDLNTKTIRIHRFYCITAEIPITISRDLISVKQPGYPELRINLPQTVQTYELGCNAIDRIFEVPKGTPAGNYRLVNIATWKANPFREGMVKLPELFIAIPADH